ncbi:hypothetical protein BJ875DRAFT_387283, partial [Amylocarpus encephaloides]
SYCNHLFNLLKSELTLIQWVCSLCYTRPHWYNFECKYCKQNDALYTSEEDI